MDPTPDEDAELPGVDTDFYAEPTGVEVDSDYISQELTDVDGLGQQDPNTAPTEEPSAEPLTEPRVEDTKGVGPRWRHSAPERPDPVAPSRPCCGKTRQSKRPSSILVIQCRISGNLLSSLFIQSPHHPRMGWLHGMPGIESNLRSMLPA